MWLSAEYFIGLLSVIQGFHFSDALDIDAHSDPCIAKILSCDWYRQPFSLYKEKDIGMFTKIEDLNKACKEQAAYMRCIVRAENFCEQTIFLTMAEEMIKSRLFPVQICRPASSWQQLYLKEASCLNAYSRKAFEHCIDTMIGNLNPDDTMIGIGNLNPDDTFERECKYGRAIIDCSTTELQEKCGYYAGNILKKFLKFHSLSDYKCSEFKPKDVEHYSFSTTPYYDITEAISSVLEAAVFGENFDNETTEGADNVNTNFEGTKLDHLESQISSDDSKSEEAFTIFDFNHPLADESSMTTEYSFSDSLDSDAESPDMIAEPDKFEFPALPKYHYIHKNRTTFALYENLEMGHMKYMGCGEADVFFFILSPLRSKYCTLTDLKSEYSEAIFKCTVRIDAPCSPKLDDEDRSKKAEVFHRRYVATVFTPPNHLRSEDMAIMNVHYLKLYPSPSIYIPEKKVNLWTAQANNPNIKQTESVGRKGPLEFEDDRSDILYQHGNGFGQKWDKDTMNSPTHLDEYEESENWDYYPLEEEDNIYFPELLTNNIIYIKDDNGDLISLHDHPSPIYSKSVYQPHPMFHPRTGAMPESTDPQHFDEIRTNRKRRLVQRSIFKERVSEFQDDALVSKAKPDHQEYCSAEAPCAPNSEFISGFGIKPGMDILSLNIKTFDPLKEMNQLHQRCSSSTKLNEVSDLKQFLSSVEVYLVTPSAKIEVAKSTESSQTEERYEDEFATDRSRYSPKEDEFATDRSRCSPKEDEFATDRSRYSPGEDEFATDRSRYSPGEDEFATDRSRYSPGEDEFATDRSRYSPGEDEFATDRSRYSPGEDEFATDRSRYSPGEDEFATDRSRYSPGEDEFATDRSRYSPGEDEFATDRSRYSPGEDEFATDRSRYSPGEDEFATDRSRYSPGEDEFATDRSRYSPGEDEFATDRSRYSPGEDEFATDRSRYSPGEDEFATDRSRYSPGEDEFATDRSRYSPGEDEFATDRSRYSPGEDEFATDRSRYSPGEDEFATDRSRYSPGEDEFATDRSRYSPGEDEFATDRSRYSPGEDEFATDRSRFSPGEDEFATDRSRYSPGEDEFATDRSRYSPGEDEFATDRSRYSPGEDEFATDRSRYSPGEEAYDNVIDIARDSRYLDPDYSTVTSAQNSADSKID